MYPHIIKEDEYIQFYKETKQTKHVARNIEARSFIHGCNRKAISFTCSMGVFVALLIQRAMPMHHTVICRLPNSTIFFHIILQTA